MLPQNGAPTREAKAPPLNWRAKAQTAIEQSRRQAPQPLSYAPERESRASMTWNIIRPAGLY